MRHVWVDDSEPDWHRCPYCGLRRSGGRRAAGRDRTYRRPDGSDQAGPGDCPRMPLNGSPHPSRPRLRKVGVAARAALPKRPSGAE